MQMRMPLFELLEIQTSQLCQTTSVATEWQSSSPQPPHTQSPNLLLGGLVESVVWVTQWVIPILCSACQRCSSLLAPAQIYRITRLCLMFNFQTFDSCDKVGLKIFKFFSGGGIFFSLPPKRVFIVAALGTLLRPLMSSSESRNLIFHSLPRFTPRPSNFSAPKNRSFFSVRIFFRCRR